MSPDESIHVTVIINGKAAQHTVSGKPAVAAPARPDRGLFTSGYLSSLGFQAKTIIDIGVRIGTPPLYRAFPNCDFLLVDPQRGGEALLRFRPDRFRFINLGLGAAPGKIWLNESGAMSSLLPRTPLTDVPTQERYEVDVTTIEALLAEHPVERDIGLKIDTEGYELEILKGLGKHWPDVEFIICEISVRRRFEGSYLFTELVTFLGEHGFAFFNILNTPVPRPRFYDVLFVRQDSALLN